MAGVGALCLRDLRLEREVPVGAEHVVEDGRGHADVDLVVWTVFDSDDAVPFIFEGERDGLCWALASVI